MEISLDKTKSIFKIIQEALYLYATNFFAYTKVMIFPIVAHLIGIPYILGIAYFLPDYLTDIFSLQYIIENQHIAYLLVIIATLPGFILFLAGFWAYLVAMVSLNRFTEAIIKEDEAVTTKICAEYVKKRKTKYIYVLALMMLLWIVAFIFMLVPFILSGVIPACILSLLIFLVGLFVILFLLCISIYLSLSFQVFAFEDVSVMDVFKRSFNLIDKNFCRTLFLLLVLYIITGILAPFIIGLVFDLTGLLHLIAQPVNWFSERFLTQIEQLSYMYSSDIVDSVKQSASLMNLKDPVTDLSKMVISNTISSVVTCGMLPLGTIAFTLLYFDIVNKKKAQIENDNV